MPRWAIGFIATIVPLLGEAGLQVSGFQSITLAIILWVITSLGIVFLILTIKPVAKRIKWPLLRNLISESPKKASEQHDLEMGEHLSKIKDVLMTLKEQLIAIEKSENIC